jgi:hypothetical protein
MSYSTYSPSSPSTPIFASCKFRKALLRGFRPSAQNQKVICGVCPNRCIYCDIWKLATLVYSHAPAIQKSHSRQSSSSSTLSRSSSTASNSSDSDDEMGTKAIQAAFQAQRARLASILSICTVEGADECDGLRLAHDRCLMSVTDLINKERMLQERMLQEQAAAVRHEYPVQIESTQRQLSSRRSNRDCGSATMRERYLSGSREGSHVGLAR